MNKFYQATAVIFLNLVLLSAASLLILWGALEARHALTGRGNVVISDAIKFNSFRLTPPDAARAAAAEFDAYASSHPFVFNPWTTFMLSPVAGRYLNVLQGPILNHRAVTGAGAAPVSEPRIRIWCFGGSTLYGFGVPDSQTIPSHLQRILNEYEKLGPVEVVNFGQPYWFSSVEVAAYNSLLQSERRPDAVIFLDGLNDMANLVAGRTTPYFAGQADAAWARKRADARHMLPWLTINESFPLSRIARFVEGRFLGMPKSVPAYRPANPLDARHVVDIYMDNLKKAKALSEGFGVRAFFFLQPVPWYGQYAAKDVTTGFPFGDKQTALSAYEDIASRFSGRDDARALHESLLNHEAPFVDNFHYSDSANALLAAELVDFFIRAIYYFADVLLPRSRSFRLPPRRRRIAGCCRRRPCRASSSFSRASLCRRS